MQPDILRNPDLSITMQNICSSGKNSCIALFVPDLSNPISTWKLNSHRLNLPSDVLILVRASEEHADVVDNESLAWLKVDEEAALGVLLDGDFPSSLLGLDDETGGPMS